MKPIARILILLVCLLPFVSHAQPGFGDDVDDVPIDGGISLLIAAGAGYAIQRIKKTSSNHYKHS